jgi:hypothetical protein
MIVEERIYSLAPGRLPEFLKAYEAYGLPVSKEILGRLIGYFSTEFGPLNQIVNLWAYEDLADRSVRRARLAADPRWAEYRQHVKGFVTHQENKLLLPAPFSPGA